MNNLSRTTAICDLSLGVSPHLNIMMRKIFGRCLGKLFLDLLSLTALIICVLLYSYTWQKLANERARCLRDILQNILIKKISSWQFAALTPVCVREMLNLFSSSRTWITEFFLYEYIDWWNTKSLLSLK